MLEIFIGFDSAWTDNAKAPGAICALARQGDRYDFTPPRLARFSDAATFIEHIALPESLVLIALDQPTRVPNLEGARPAERVAASVISRLGGGVQPARRGGGGASMFGDAAPVWPFLARLQATEDPIAAKLAHSGRYLIEVFPALALPSIIPAIWGRGRAAKYNPAAPSYLREDWPLVCEGAAAFANTLGILPVTAWLLQAAENVAPKKSDQDRLDAVLCLLVAIQWRMGPPEGSMVIGDLHNGYIVTPGTADVGAVLRVSASTRGVPINEPDIEIENRLCAHTIGSSAPAVLSAKPAFRHTPASVPTRAAEAMNALKGRAGFKVEARALRALLVKLARAGKLITYGEVAAHFDQPWHQGFGASLTRALNEVGRVNRDQGEPDLMGVVVNKETRMPGEGFFVSLGLVSSTPVQRRAAHEQQGLIRRKFVWPDDAEAL